jgi:hypothetical protein
VHRKLKFLCRVFSVAVHPERKPVLFCKLKFSSISCGCDYLMRELGAERHFPFNHKYSEVILWTKYKRIFIVCAIMRIIVLLLLLVLLQSELFIARSQYYYKVWNIKLYRIIGPYNDAEIRLCSVSRSLMEIRCRCYQWI